MNNTTPTPHKHAALIKEWADHLATGKLDAGWYKVEVRNMNLGWDTIRPPSWSAAEYRIVMTDKHPDYKPPVEMITVSFEMPKGEAITQAKKLFVDISAAFYLSQLTRTAIKQALEKQNETN